MSPLLEVSTGARAQMVDITDRVRDAVRASGVEEGLCLVFVPHTTAGITIQENADPDVQVDFLAALDEAVKAKLPGKTYLHAEGNSPAHVKASLLGSSASLVVQDGELALGTWQGIYLCEFDGPRTRRVRVKVVNG